VPVSDQLAAFVELQQRFDADLGWMGNAQILLVQRNALRLLLNDGLKSEMWYP